LQSTSDLADLNHAQDQRPVWRVEIQARDAAHLFDEQRFFLELKALVSSLSGLGHVFVQQAGTFDAQLLHQ